MRVGTNVESRATTEYLRIDPSQSQHQNYCKSIVNFYENFPKTICPLDWKTSNKYFDLILYDTRILCILYKYVQNVYQQIQNVSKHIISCLLVRMAEKR